MWTFRPRCHGLNELKKRWMWAREVKQWKAAIRQWLLVNPFTPLTRPVRLYAVFLEGHALRDPKNIDGGAWKAVLDAFQECGVLREDNWEVIAGDDGFERFLDKHDPRFILVLTEV